MDRNFRASELRGRTLGSVMKDKEEDLALFIEMRKRDKERNSLLLHNSEELDQPLESRLGGSPLFKIAPSAVRKTGMDDFLNSDSEKNDYDWLLTPPGTPLFPSLEKESHRSPIRQLSTPKGHPVLLKSRLANHPDPSSRYPAASAQLMTSSGLNSLSTMRRPSSSGGSSVTSRPSTPNGRTSLPLASKSSRSLTPSSRPTAPLKPAPPPRSSSPARPSAPASKAIMPPVRKPLSRTPTPTKRPSSPSILPSAPPQPVRSSPATSSTMRQSSSPSSSMRSGPSISTRSAPTVSKSLGPSKGSLPIVKSTPWKPSEMPGFSLNTPPNLRTSLPERPSSASRGRPSAPISRSSSVDSRQSGKMPRRQSCSPSRGRASNGIAGGGGSFIPAVSRSRINNTDDNESPVSIGTKMVERVVSSRRLAPPKNDDHRSTAGKSSAMPESSGFGRTISKKSIDMALRHMDIRKSIPNNLRPFATNISPSSMHNARLGSSKSRAVSMSDSPLATSSNASSEQSGSNAAFCLDGNELLDDFYSDKGGKSSPSFSIGR